MRRLENLTDTELIIEFRKGHNLAFSILYKRYQRKVFETVVYYIKDRTEAEDLSQEVYIKVITSIQANRYCEEGKFLPWVLRIAHNHCMDHLRKRTHVSYVAHFSSAQLSTVATASPEYKLINKQTAAQLRTLVDKLSAEQKQVVCYRHFEELSFKEISERTNSSVNTALGRMRYGLMHLRLMVQNQPSLTGS